MLYLPFNDPEAAYKTVKDFGDKKGVVGFMVTSPRYKPVHDNAYVKTYALLEEMGKPIAFHAAYNWNDQSLSLTNRFISVHALGFMWFNMVHMTNWVINGLPERFPKLKVMWIESGLTWAYCLMQRLDHSYMMRTSDCPSLKRKPSEYMREMYYSSQPMEMPDDPSILEATFKMINAETQLMWSSDYPHWDFDLPSVIYDLPFLSESAKRNILGGNAAKAVRPRHQAGEEDSVTNLRAGASAAVAESAVASPGARSAERDVKPKRKPVQTPSRNAVRKHQVRQPRVSAASPRRD